MNQSIDIKPPRLHDANALDAVADWLTYWSPEQWDVGSVLARFGELTSPRYEIADLFPEGVKVVVPTKTVLINKLTGERTILQRHVTLLVGGNALHGFVKDLHEHGEAIPTCLVDEYGPTRWLIETPLTRASVRLVLSQVELLLPSFESLQRDISRGEHRQFLLTLDSAQLGSAGPHVTTLEEERQNRRYQMCIDAGLKMPTNDYANLPRGIGKLAAKEGITRQAFAEDIKKRINRLKTAGERQVNGRRLPADI